MPTVECLCSCFWLAFPEAISATLVLTCFPSPLNQAITSTFGQLPHLFFCDTATRFGCFNPSSTAAASLRVHFATPGFYQDVTQKREHHLLPRSTPAGLHRAEIGKSSPVVPPQ
jgi:hypothetical protein